METAFSLKDLSYTLNSDSLGIRDFASNKRQSVTIPSGTIVKVVKGPYNGDLLLEVAWNREVFLVFTDDVKNHATLLAKVPDLLTVRSSRAVSAGFSNQRVKDKSWRELRTDFSQSLLRSAKTPAANALR